MYTPGHSPDHLALWHGASGSIFSGDLVIPGRSVAIDVSRGGRMADYLASREKLRKLEPRQPGLRSVEAIADSIYDRVDLRLMAAARENVRAHLDKLKAEGKAAADHDGGWTLRT